MSISFDRESNYEIKGNMVNAVHLRDAKLGRVVACRAGFKMNQHGTRT